MVVSPDQLNPDEKQEQAVKKDLNALCRYAKTAVQYQGINEIVDNLEESILQAIGLKEPKTLA